VDPIEDSLLLLPSPSGKKFLVTPLIYATFISKLYRALLSIAVNETMLHDHRNGKTPTVHGNVGVIEFEFKTRSGVKRLLCGRKIDEIRVV